MGRARGRRPAVAGVAAVLLVAACSPGTPDAPPPAPSSTALPSWGAPADVVTGLDVPWSVVFADGAPLVSERDTGRVLEVLRGGSTREVGTVPDVVHGGEGGLLGLAVDADDRLYAYSTGPDGNRIQRYPLRGGPGSWALGDPVTVVDGLPSAGNHNGGRIAFGPDGMLYAGVGDAGDPASAQDPGALSGKILRLTPDGDVPADNPDPGSPVYSLGHRNVQGLAWAPDGRLFATEFGQDTWDELNVIEPGGNYGWPEVEGVAGDPRFVDPVQQWSPDAASPSGLAAVGDVVVVANLRGERLRLVPVAEPGTAIEALTDRGRLRDVALAPDGTLWVLTNNTARGEPRPGDDRALSVPLAGGATRGP